MKNSKISFTVALGGITAALSLLLMFMAAIVPVLTYAMPAAAGALMAVIVIEINKKWAVTTYAAVAVLSLILVPSMEASLLFAAFMGFYPILKSVLEKIKKRAVRLGLKLIVFNVSMIVYYQLVIRFVSDAELLEDSGDLGKYGLLILLAAANVVFVVYDLALTRLISMYYNWFRKKFLRRL